jgi:AraC family transcriptional regulator
MYLTLDDQGIGPNFDRRSGSFVVFSKLTNFESKVPFNNFAIKYVAKGRELYNINGKDYMLSDSQYLLGNSSCVGEVEVNSSKPVTGICIDIDQPIISSILASYVAPDTSDLDLTLDTYFGSNGFTEESFDARTTSCGKMLQQFELKIHNNPYEEYVIEKEFFFRFGEAIINDYSTFIQQTHKLRSVKDTTRRELVKKINLGKAFIDDHFLMQMDIDVVARESHISLYHFYRLFKLVHGISPYQYIKNKRLAKAGEILAKERMSVAQLAVEVGYSDIHAFSKAFKQYYGCPPSQF